MGTAVRSDLYPPGGHLADLIPIQEEPSFWKEGFGHAHGATEPLDEPFDGLLIAHCFDGLDDRIYVVGGANLSRARKSPEVMTSLGWPGSKHSLVSKYLGFHVHEQPAELGVPEGPLRADEV